MTIIAVILILGGILGSTWGPSWLVVLCGLGLFGPYLLRESGVVPWRDDFQREMMMRAGMHALVVTGWLMVLVMAVQGIGGSGKNLAEIVSRDNFPVSVLFTTLAVTWGTSWLLQFWGVVQGSFRILIILAGSTTLLTVSAMAFNALDGQPMSFHGTWTGLAQLAWIWILAFSARRRARVTGLALLATVFLVVWNFISGWNQDMNLSLTVWILSILVAPLLVPALALIANRDSRAEEAV